MTREEAIWYLQPIADSASLPRYVEALGMAIAALREQPRWISVKERLPEINTKVLVRYKHTGEPHKRSTAFDYLYVSATNPVVFNWTQHPCRVTHWMPLPEPPEVEIT